VGTLARGLDVLELFGQQGPELSQKQISDELSLPMPTVHRLTALLTERGWLDRDATTRRLRLGTQMARLVPAMLS
jgi:IclR family acetate operon transcriptional repressor